MVITRSEEPGSTLLPIDICAPVASLISLTVLPPLPITGLQ